MNTVRVIIFFVAAFYLYDKFFSGASEGAAEKNIESWELAVYTPEDLVDAYDENTLRADSKFKGSEFLLKGRVSEISTSITGSPYLVLGTNTRYGLYDPIANFVRHEDWKLESLSKGQRVVLRCFGAGDIAKKPILDNCKMVADNGELPTKPKEKPLECNDSSVITVAFNKIALHKSLININLKNAEFEESMQIGYNSHIDERICRMKGSLLSKDNKTTVTISAPFSVSIFSGEVEDAVKLIESPSTKENLSLLLSDYKAAKSRGEKSDACAKSILIGDVYFQQANKLDANKWKDIIFRECAI